MFTLFQKISYLNLRLCELSNFFAAFFLNVRKQEVFTP